MMLTREAITSLMEGDIIEVDSPLIGLRRPDGTADRLVWRVEKVSEHGSRRDVKLQLFLRDVEIGAFIAGLSGDEIHWTNISGYRRRAR